MSAEARNVAEELFKLVDKDNSGKISEAEFADANGTAPREADVLEGVVVGHHSLPMANRFPCSPCSQRRPCLAPRERRCEHH